MNAIAMVLVGLLFAAQTPPIGRADSAFDKKANFAALRTYAWTQGGPAFHPEAHKIIVAAIEKEMASLGFTQVAGEADVTLAYYTTTVSNVDFKALDQFERDGKTAPSKELGKLVVVMRGAASREQLWSAGSREYLDPDIAKLGATVQAVAARLFATYPLAKAKK